MILIYLLIALTFSTVLSALLSAYISEDRNAEVFIGVFVALMALAWAADVWLLPALAAGLKAAWLPIMTVLFFGAVLVASAVLSVRTPRLLRQTFAGHGGRIGAEAAVFDLLLWFALLIAGIAALKSFGK